MNEVTLLLIGTYAFWLAGIIISLWILWAIIRGAVLSALRKHSYEQAMEAHNSRKQAANSSPATTTGRFPTTTATATPGAMPSAGPAQQAGSLAATAATVVTPVAETSQVPPLG
ncbi:hypothetical protein ICM05_06645 [Leucobacter sp. cx-42]|uniref:hypothetical protein n=1 Tax=unclassified Leucobacter TaxID=2621730 RepID=UPI00165D52ED|nr:MULTISPECIES: hypothetical protein [unclassified Leucobacter]MBC9954324.1 hypothetical protein [Leucobacter sp. cx-42]